MSMPDQTSTTKPNILVLMTDQHRWDMLTCAGNSAVPTPNLDRIAAAGVRLENAYCSYPVSLASRSSLLTGLYAHTTGAINNRDRLDWRYRTLAHHFAQNGYLTGLIGKMHFGDAHNHGFEYYLTINDWLMYLGGRAQHYANEIANHPLSPHFYDTVDDDGAGLPDVADLWLGKSPWAGQVERFDFRSMASQLPAEDHLDMFIARESIKFLKRYRNQSFFLISSFMKPHTPLFAPREWAERYPVDQVRLPDPGDFSTYPQHVQDRIQHFLRIDPECRKAHMAGYMANLAFVDTCVGAVYASLAELGLLDNTIVVYTSDHGEMHGTHGMFQKFCLFEPAVKVPLIVSYPKRIPRGRVSQALIEYMGLYPTLAELSGTPAPSALECSSFADVLTNPDACGPAAAFSEYNLRARVCEYMIRTPQYKYVYHQDAGAELYDLHEDPGEVSNLVQRAGTAGLVNRLREQLFAWYDPNTNPFKKRE